MKVYDILEQKGYGVHALARTSTLQQAVDVLGSKNIGALVITETDDTVCGILSERDIVRHLSISGTSILTGPIDDYMTKNVVTATKESHLDDVSGLMTKRRIRHLPIVEDGKLAGIITIGDVVKRKIELAESEAESLKQYIAAG